MTSTNHSLKSAGWVALALLGAIAPSGEAQRRDRGEDGLVYGPRGEVLGRENRFDLAVGGVFSQGGGPAVSIEPAMIGVEEITLTQTGTGWLEPFLLGTPDAPIAPEAPLLVAFHGYGRSMYEVLLETNYFGQARARGWYVVAPLGAHKFNFGVPYAQENIHAVLEWVTENYPIDSERIYGVGFSMGGGGVLNFASRYLDPAEPMLAAVVDHTGTVSIRDEYNEAFSTDLFENPLMFGGSPTEQPFAYQLSSTIDLLPGGVIGDATDLLRNLAHVPVRMWTVDQDPLQHLVAQTLSLHGHAPSVKVATENTSASGTEHSWGTLNETSVLDYFEPLRLTLPSPGQHVDVLADRDATYFWFDVTQDHVGAFSPFTWRVDVASNMLVLDDAANLAQLRFDPLEVGLSKDQPIQLELATLDGANLDLVLEGFVSPPSSVQRDGVLTNSWSYDANCGCLTLSEVSSGTTRNWVIEL